MISLALIALIFFVGACLFVWKIKRDLGAGAVKVVGGFVDRESNPGRYYFNIAIQAVAALLFLVVPAFILLVISFPNCSTSPAINMILSCPYAAH